MSKKRSHPKPRIQHIYATTVANNLSELVITIDQATGEIAFQSPMTNAYSETSYERSRKDPKVISRVPQESTVLSFDGNSALHKNYDFICAVDTNTRSIQEQLVSVTGIVIGKHSHLPGPKGLRSFWKTTVPFCFEYVGLKVDKPENFGWLMAVDSLVERGLIDPAHKKIGMIVDSDLGNMNDFNNGKKPIFQNRHLPDFVRLIYASADTGKENIENQLLSIADSVSTQVLDALAKGEVAFNSKKSNGHFYEALRIVFPK